MDILRIRPATSENPALFERLAVIDSPFRAMSLCGDLLALSDELKETHIVNWRTGEKAILLSPDDASEYNFMVWFLRRE